MISARAAMYSYSKDNPFGIELSKQNGLANALIEFQYN